MQQSKFATWQTIRMCPPGIQINMRTIFFLHIQVWLNSLSPQLVDQWFLRIQYGLECLESYPYPTTRE